MLYVAGFLRFLVLACVMLVGLMAIIDFVAEQTANDDCAKVQLVRKKNIFSVCQDCRPSTSGDLLSGHLICLKVKHVVSSFNVT